ncbi:hypothetical protein IFM89_036618 [Coptis chinensis]|uniref:Cyclin-dependent protein kinase inhibitor SMR3 n=1 Tax=Coptis chinensis TaxID=261450 RepID=A0A835LLH0_9MAGN|nr:hypothetical protein IFM89_036618 [Coptis chinensis]
MYAKLDHISFVGMSNSEFLFIEKDKETIEFDFRIEFSGENQISASQECHQHEDDVKKCIKDDDFFLKKELKMPSLGELNVDENDDGFRTPTTLEHKIPVIQNCPPAPKKPKSLPSRKRKGSPNHHRIRVDLSEEIEVSFSPVFLDDLGRKMKKANRNVTK